MRDTDDETEDEEDDDEDRESFRERLADYFRERMLVLAWVVPVWALVLEFSSRAWLLELSRHFMVYWLGLALGLAGCMCWWRRWIRAGLCGFAALLFFLPLLPYFLPAPVPLPAAAAAPSPVAESGEFTVLTCNLLLSCKDPEAMRNALTEADPDVLLLLECTVEWKNELAPLLARYPTVRVQAQDDPFGIVFATRLPGVAQIIEPVGARLPAVTAVLSAGGRRFGFLGVHPMNPMLPAGSEFWRDQFAAYPAILQKLEGDAKIVAGDLNCSPFARTFRTFLGAAGLRDSALGQGITNTWTGVGLRTLGLPLDHVLISPALQVIERTVGPSVGSDHRWVKTRLAFAR